MLWTGPTPCPRSGSAARLSSATSPSVTTSSLVLQNVNLHIPAGKTTAVVGPTGVGKTTMISLIPRLYDPNEGAVMIDGRDIREFTVKSLREQVSVVLQESVLFRASIFENIAYGRANATLDEIIAAAKAANAHEFITQLPNGYETEVGERGETLSGGQRQRIAIARAMIRDAPILILDEPLVGLDAASADVVLEALERLTAGRTAIVISHLLSSVQNADHVIVLDSGRVVREGTLEEMIAVDAQDGGFIRTRPTVNSDHQSLRQRVVKGPRARASRWRRRHDRRRVCARPLFRRRRTRAGTSSSSAAAQGRVFSGPWRLCLSSCFSFRRRSFCGRDGIGWQGVAFGLRHGGFHGGTVWRLRAGISSATSLWSIRLRAGIGTALIPLAAVALAR